MSVFTLHSIILADYRDFVRSYRATPSVGE